MLYSPARAPAHGDPEPLDRMKINSIRIATWNCFGTPQSIEDFFESRPFWPERLCAPAVIETLRQYDIVCVQENFVEGVRAALVQIQREAEFSELWLDPLGYNAADKTLTGSGLAILSRFPMDVYFEKLARGGGPDGLARKGFARARVRLPGGQELYVHNTHLQADDFRVGDEECRRIRRRQIERLVQSVLEVMGPGIPSILCGDLNVPAGTDEYDEIASLLLPTHHDPVDTSVVTYDTINNEMTRAFHCGGPDQGRLDHIWVDRGVESHEPHLFLQAPLDDVPSRPADYGGRVFASDHFGLGMTIKLK